MRRLLLLRHAKAERSQPGGRDHERHLAERGRRDAPTIGAYMARHGYAPDRVIVSTSTRTRETWELAAAEMPGKPTVAFEQRVYDASAQTLLQISKETGPKIHTLLMIGHNPGMHELAVQLIATGDVEARQQLKEALPTSGLVAIEFAVDRWDKLHPQGGRLEHFVTPRLLEAGD